MPKPRLTKAERLVNEQMLALLEWAEPGRWCPLGRDEATLKAAELHAARGVIEIQPMTNVYRLKPEKPKKGP